MGVGQSRSLRVEHEAGARVFFWLSLRQTFTLLLSPGIQHLLSVSDKLSYPKHYLVNLPSESQRSLVKAETDFNEALKLLFSEWSISDYNSRNYNSWIVVAGSDYLAMEKTAFCP